MANIVKTSEKHEVYFNVFHSECKMSSRFTSKILTNEQNTKLALIFYSECSVSSPFTAKITKT